MGSFNDVVSAEQVERLYIGKRVIYLESEEDVQVFRERWFFDVGAVVDFAPATTGGSGGCGNVRNQVTADREARINAWGIVDRDALAAPDTWDVFFECDDAAFLANQQLGPYIFALRYWEMENYLLHPEVLEGYLADIEGRTPRPTEAIVEELFRLICSKLPVLATKLTLHYHGKPPLPEKFGHNEKNWSKLIDSLEERLTDSGISSEALENFVEKIGNFGNSSPPRTIEHWLALLRILDGKQVIDWIRERYGLKDECRFQWARRLREHGKLEVMLEDRIRRLASGAPM